MRFTSVLKKLIVENSRFKVLYDKMVTPSPKALEKNPKAKGFMTFDILKNIIFADPTTKAPENFDIEGASINDMENVKVGKFTQWMLKHFVAPTLTEDMVFDPQSKEFKDVIKRYRALFLEDLFKLTEQLEYYERAKQYLPQEKRDINKLTPSDLQDIYANFKLPEKKLKDIEKKEARKTREGFKHAGGKIVHEGNDWVVIKIEGNNTTSKDAAIYYGGYKDYQNDESNWCTSSPNLDYFSSYINRGPLYVIFPQDDKGEVGKRTGLPKERYQFHFGDKMYMDRHDKRVDIADFLSDKAPELKDLFRNELLSATSGFGGKGEATDEIKINYPSSIADYIKLYGFDDIFKNIPKTTKTFIFTNTSKSPVDIKLPKEFFQLKDLETLTLDGCISELSEDIGQLTELSILSLPNNTNLKALPKSLAKLENLNFINLDKSNPNIIIPEELKEKLVDEGEQFYYVM